MRPRGASPKAFTAYGGNGPGRSGFAIISGCAYIPFEVYKVIRRPNQLHWAILGINILVVLYIAWVRWDEIKAARMQLPEAPGEAH